MAILKRNRLFQTIILGIWLLVFGSVSCIYIEFNILSQIFVPFPTHPLTNQEMICWEMPLAAPPPTAPWAAMFGSWGWLVRWCQHTQHTRNPFGSRISTKKCCEIFTWRGKIYVYLAICVFLIHKHRNRNKGPYLFSKSFCKMFNFPISLSVLGE